MPHRQLVSNIVQFAPRPSASASPEPLPTVNVFQADHDGMLGIDAIVPLRVAVAFLKLLQGEGIVPEIGGDLPALDG